MRCAGRILTLCAAVALAGPVHALSCVAPDVATSFAYAQEAEAAYLVVHGKVDYDMSQVPERTIENQFDGVPTTNIPGHMTGMALSKAGFKTPFDKPVTVAVECYGMWCGGAASGTPHMFFVERREGGYVLSLRPCGDFAIYDPTPEMLNQAVQCIRGKACEPAY